MRKDMIEGDRGILYNRIDDAFENVDVESVREGKIDLLVGPLERILSMYIQWPIESVNASSQDDQKLHYAVKGKGWELNVEVDICMEQPIVDQLKEFLFDVLDAMYTIDRSIIEIGGAQMCKPGMSIRGK